MSDWFNSENCSGVPAVGYSSMPYFICGTVATIFLLYVAWNLYVTRNTVRRGMKSIDVILPMYQFPVWYVITVGIIIGITNIIGIQQEQIYTSIVKWGLYRVAVDGLAVFLMHNGIGMRALRHAVIGGLFWSTVTSGTILFAYFESGYKAYSYTTITWLALTAIFYLCMWLIPQRFVHRRPAMVTYAFWNVVILLLFIAVCVFLAQEDDYDIATCSVEIILSICWMMQPFIILYTVRQDSLFWQGLYRNPQYTLFGYSFRGNPIKSFANNRGPALNEPLLGIWDFGRETMGILADSITMLEKKVVPIIPFSFIEIDNSRYFSGGTARVYRGKYGAYSVAVKFLFCLELTPERVADFCAEATLLNSLQHDNVVGCYGVSVMPPAMCLVTEFCLYGSLFDFLHKTDMVVSEYHEGNSSNTDVHGNRGRLGTGSTHAWTSPSVSSESGEMSSGSPVRSRSASSHNSDSHRDSLEIINSNVGSKHIRPILDLPDIKEGNETSFDQSVPSIATASTPKARHSELASTNSSIVEHRSKAVPHNNDRNESADRTLDMALTLAQVAKVPTIDKTYKNQRTDNFSGSDSEGMHNGATYGPGLAHRNFRRRRLDSAEYLIEKDADLDNVADSHSMGHSSGSAINETSEAQLTTRLLSTDQENGGADVTGTFGSLSNSGTSAHVVLRKLSSIMNEDGTAMGMGPQPDGHAQHVRSLRELAKELREHRAVRSSAHDSDEIHAASKRLVEEHSNQSSQLLPEAAQKNWNGGISLRPTSPIGSNDGSNPRHITHLAPAAQISVPARVRLTSFGLDGSANVSSYLVSSEGGRDSSGSAYRNSGYESSQAQISLQSRSHLPSHNHFHRPKKTILVLPLSLRLRMAKDCCSGVAYLHANGFMHCDIKSLNFLVDSDLNVKLSDLGEARSSSQASQDFRLFPSNINWSAPEVLSEQATITAAADIWSLAMVIVEILTGEVPFDTQDWRNLRMDTFLGRLREGQRPYIPASISDQFPWLPKLIGEAWRFSAAERCDSIHMLDVFTAQIQSGFAYQSK